MRVSARAPATRLPAQRRPLVVGAHFERLERGVRGGVFRQLAGGSSLRHWQAPRKVGSVSGRISVFNQRQRPRRARRAAVSARAAARARGPAAPAARLAGAEAEEAARRQEHGGTVNGGVARQLAQQLQRRRSGLRAQLRAPCRRGARVLRRRRGRQRLAELAHGGVALAPREGPVHHRVLEPQRRRPRARRSAGHHLQPRPRAIKNRGRSGARSGNAYRRERASDICSRYSATAVAPSAAGAGRAPCRRGGPCCALCLTWRCWTCRCPAKTACPCRTSRTRTATARARSADRGCVAFPSLVSCECCRARALWS